MLYRFKSCTKCNGDLVLDGDEWRCWQCGTYYYPNDPVMDLPPEVVESDLLFQAADCEAKPRRVRARPKTNINSVIMAKERSDYCLWTKNREIIDRLNQGYSVREISEQVGKGQRQIRGVQERLKDMALAS